LLYGTAHTVDVFSIKAAKASFRSYLFPKALRYKQFVKSFSPAPPLKTRFGDLWRRVWWVSKKLGSFLRVAKDKSFLTGLPLLFC